MVINNAGYTFDSALNDTPLEQLKQLTHLQIDATMEITHATIGAIRQNKGYFINVASLAALLPSPANPTYSAAKAFIFCFSQSIHTHIYRHGASCTVACPGPIITEFHRKLGLDPEQLYRKHGLFKALSAKRAAKLIISDAENRKALTIPGANNKLIYALLKLTPNWLLIAVLTRVNRPRP